MSSQQTFSLRWNDYSSYIAGAFESIRQEEDLVDVTLYCEGRKIRAHKILLSACSSYFKEIFKENPCQHPIIIFKNIKYVDLLSLVQFIYLGEVNVMQDSLSSFLHTADMLAVRGLSDAPMEEQPPSSLMQRILGTQSCTENNATITKDPDCFAPPTSTSITTQQLNSEPQSPVSQIFINNALLKLANDQPTCGLDTSIVTHAPQQQKPNSTPPLHIPARSYGNALNSANIVSMTPAKELPHQSRKSTAALQELVGSVTSTTRPVNIARVFSPIDSIEAQEATRNVKPTASYTSLDTTSTATTTTNREPSSNNESEMYGTVNEDVKVNISEFISVGKSLATDSGTSGAFTQPPGFQLMCEEISNQPESRQTPEHSNSFKMPNVDTNMEILLSNEDDPPKETILGSAVKMQEKKHKCTVCDKSFVAWKSLMMHSDSHTGRTQCPICGVVLSRTANLKRHMKLRHEP